MSTTDEKRLREADLWFAAFEQGKVWDKATARACFIAGHALGHQAATREAESAKPYGQITTHSQTGQQFFFRWPESPYLDNASECVAVYTREPAAPADARDALTERITGYLTGGGLFNPEMANHDAVRDLLIDCRAALTRQAAAPSSTAEFYELYDGLGTTMWVKTAAGVNLPAGSILLAQQAPTPAVLSEPPHCPQCNTASLQLRCTHCFADFPVPPAVSKPAAPVDARDALQEIHNWLVCWPIATAEDMAGSFDYMERLADAALARQAAAPAEGDPK